MSKKPRILVVDDEAAMRESLMDWLMEDDYEVSAASSGENAISIVQDNDFEVVLLDLKMPGMDGIETMKRIKEINPEIEIVMMTAYATVDTAIQAMILTKN